MEMPTRRKVLSECLIVFEALKRRVSKNMAGLEPLPGYESDFEMDDSRCNVIREMIRDMEEGKMPKEWEKDGKGKVTEIRDWQRDVMEHGPQMDLKLR